MQARITETLAATAPAAKVQNSEEYAGALRAQVNQLLTLVTALVLLAVVIALLGVLITMLLAVLERTHELGSAAGHRHGPGRHPVHGPVGGRHHRHLRRRCWAWCSASGSAMP